MTDETEQPRRERIAELSTEATDNRAELEARHGRVWTTQELSAEFTVTGFMAPFVVVRRKADRQQGSLEFQHHPRYYFSFMKFSDLEDGVQAVERIIDHLAKIRRAKLLERWGERIPFIAPAFMLGFLVGILLTSHWK